MEGEVLTNLGFESVWMWNGLMQGIGWTSSVKSDQIPKVKPEIIAYLQVSPRRHGGDSCQMKGGHRRTAGAARHLAATSPLPKDLPQ